MEQSAQGSENKMRKVYGYSRLSRDEDKKNYGSIETQTEIIYEFARENGWNVDKMFIDDDVSGYIPIENRPSFCELYETVNESKEKPIVLMKDLSRLSRNNGIAQMILNKWKTDEVELILIKQRGSIFNLLKDDDDIVGIETWFNERYVKDTSRKVRDALSQRMKAGIVIQGPRYGYIKGKNGTLTVNEEVREAIQTIFNLYEEGYGTIAITKKLNLEYDYKNPSIVEAERFKRQRGRDIKRNVREYWEVDMVNKILKDETYTGTLVTHKKEVKGIHGKAKVLPKEENYRFENHHEPIISQEQFDKVQEILKNRKESTSLYKKGKHYYIFGGFLKCGDCGSAVCGIYRWGKKYYECLNYSKYRKLRCVYHNISEDYILENFKIFLKEIREKYKDVLKEMNLEAGKKKSKNNIEKLEVKLDRVKQEYRTIQVQKIKEITKAETEEEKDVVEDVYQEITNQKLKEITEITETLNYIKRQTKESKTKNIKKAIDYFDEIIKSDQPSKEVLAQVLDKIIITKNNNLEFKLKMSIEKLI